MASTECLAQRLRGGRAYFDLWFEGPVHQDGSRDSSGRSAKKQRLLLSVLTRLRPHLVERAGLST